MTQRVTLSTVKHLKAKNLIRRGLLKSAHTGVRALPNLTLYTSFNELREPNTKGHGSKL